MGNAVVFSADGRRGLVVPAGVALLQTWLVASPLWADGMAVGPKSCKGAPYEGSVEERAREAILIFHGWPDAGKGPRLAGRGRRRPEPPGPKEFPPRESE